MPVNISHASEFKTWLQFVSLSSKTMSKYFSHSIMLVHHASSCPSQPAVISSDALQEDAAVI